jgi:hypothetical protein
MNPLQQFILQDFPSFELSYEKIIHNKVPNSFPNADIYLAIPFGIKCFIWFTTFDDNNICYCIELDYHTNQIKNIKEMKASFSNSLILGTIFYGTLFQYNNNNCICLEDIYFYKGNFYNKSSYLQKLELFRIILKEEITSVISNTNQTIFGLPVLSNNYESLLSNISLLPYKINSIKLRFFDYKNHRNIFIIKYFNNNINNQSNNQSNNQTNNQSNYQSNNQTNYKNCKPLTTNYRTFFVKPDIEPDIYYLYNNIDDKNYFDLAYIPDFKTSKFMNSLFRNIKENDNLDALEESDSESEFENSNIDKFVYLERTYKMNCIFNTKFKKWCPINVCN